MEDGRLPIPPVLTCDLCRRIERFVARSVCRAGQSVVENFGSAIVRKPRRVWPKPAVFGLSEPDLVHLDRMLSFFGESTPTIYLSPAGCSPAVAAALADRKFRAVRCYQAVLFGPPDSLLIDTPANLTIERVTHRTIDAVAQVLADANGWADSWRESAMAGVRNDLERENYEIYLAFRDATPVGAAGLLVDAAEPWAMFKDAAVLPAARGIGVHAAMLAHRIRRAAALKCELVIGGALFGSTSFRNLQHAGLRLAYVESAWERARIDS